MEKEKTFDNRYLFGFGQVSVISGTLQAKSKDENNIKLPVIEISYFTEREERNIGDIGDQNPNVEHITQLLFTNIESLDVLQHAIDHCRKELKTQK